MKAVLTIIAILYIDQTLGFLSAKALSDVLLETVAKVQKFTGNAANNFANMALDFANANYPDPEVRMTAPEMIRYWKYPAETHYLTSRDGYIKALHRIPHGRFARSASKGPILLHHGLMSSSADWVINMPENSLGYILADSGYDVWMCNARGNFFSRNHTKLDPDISSKFWDFSFQEMASIDLSQAIDYILAKTNRSKMPYIGCSMGTTVLFALLSENVPYNAKIDKFIALAPAVNLTYGTSPLKLFAPLSGINSETDLLNSFRNMFGGNEMMPLSGVSKLVANTACTPLMRGFPCTFAMFEVFGRDEDQINMTRLPVYLHHSPAGSSVRTFIHFAQIYESQRFQKFDYGIAENYRHYRQASPPEYDIRKITAPVYMFYGPNDLISNEKNTMTTARLLKNLKMVYRVKFDQFNHLDFMVAKDAKVLLYDIVLDVLNQK